jgi:methylthioribulose 1-phosphate dehydratase/enolase-phosphatase E1
MVVIAHLSFLHLLCRTKREARSYYEIWQSVGVDRPSQILFLTDVYQEAAAAKASGKPYHICLI